MAKLVNGWAKWVAIFVVIALAVGGWIWNAATVYSKVEQVCGENAEVHPRVQENREDILTMKATLTHIKEAVDRIDTKLEQ
jgi:hypothetical protein